MKTFSFVRQSFALLGLAFLASTVNAQFVGVSGSTSAPASVFGGFTMTKFADDTRPVFQDVTSVSTPLGGAISFSTELDHLEIGSGWATWSNHYRGDVYFVDGGTSVTLTLPDYTSAFYFYAEPNQFFPHTITASSGGTLLTQHVLGLAGAEFFGFYATGTETLSSITISSNDFLGFSIGEFGIALTLPTPAAFVTPVPEPSTYALFGAVALFGLVAVRRFRRKAS